MSLNREEKHFSGYYCGHIVKRAVILDPVYHLINRQTTTALYNFQSLFFSPDTDENIGDDQELQAWAAELSRPYSEGGVGINVGLKHSLQNSFPSCFYVNFMVSL